MNVKKDIRNAVFAATILFVVLATPILGKAQSDNGGNSGRNANSENSRHDDHRSSEERNRHEHPPKNRPGYFGRMFDLRPFAPPTNKVRKALMQLGKPGGILDAQDDIAAGPIALIIDPTLSEVNRDNPTHTAGTTFMGQFLDHDMTLDRTSILGVPTEPNSTPNGRTAEFDLDSVYGDGPFGSPLLYDEYDWTKFAIESGGEFEDLPRDPSFNVAIISDPRNDENLMLAGLQLAFLKFHNNAVDLVRAENPGISDFDAYLEARRLTTYHYQWMIVTEFLPQFIGQPMVDDILAHGRRYYRPRYGKAYIPVEFQIAYRFGHSMVRPSYRANLAGDHGLPFFGMIFDPAGEGSPDPIDLRGGARAPRRFIGWQTFFNFADGAVKPNKRIDTIISTPLFDLPLSAILSGTPPTVLPQRTLLRHLTWSLPSGQDIARKMHAPELSYSDLRDVARISRSFARSTPLWFYVLREADVMEDGLHLGPVGGRIVGEVFIGLLQSDPNSFVNAEPDFVPTLPTVTGVPENFSMTDFLTFAGVDPISRGQ